MCLGPDDKPQNIKACLAKASTLLLQGMLEDWERGTGDTSEKMARCIREVLTRRATVKAKEGGSK